MPKGHPTPELLQRFFEAYQSEGEAGIMRVLQEQRDKKEYVSNLIDKVVEREKAQRKNPSTK